MSTETYEEFTDRCQAIAALHAKAREARRMARFLAWLREERCCEPGYRHCAAASSPEEAILSSASKEDTSVGSGPFWVTYRAGWAWNSRLACAESVDIEKKQDVEGGYPRVVAVTRAFLASPQWWDLPWQAEPVFAPMTEAAKEAAIDRALAAKGGR